MKTREIKFKGWFKPTDWDESEPKKPPRMVYFDQMGYCDEYNHLKFQLANESYPEDGGNYSVLSADMDNFLAIMQFTGLKDKNDKEIYEGDLVLFSGNPNGAGKTDSTPLEVYIHMPQGVRLICKANGGWHYDWSKMASSWDEVEVVGNIYEAAASGGK